MKAHIDRTRHHLGELAGLAGKTETAERKILAAAEKRLAAVQNELVGIHGAEFGKDSDRYTALIAERGQLQIVVAKARRVLGLD